MIVALAIAVQAAADDWPQFLGPERNGVSPGPALAETWGANGPKVVWRKTVGAGLSGPVVAQGHLILFHRVAGNELVEALDPRSGASQWLYSYPTSYRDDFGFDEGPRAVPVVANGVVYTFGAQGQLSAIGLADGKRIWSEDTAAARIALAQAYLKLQNAAAARTELERALALDPSSADAKRMLGEIK